MIVPPLHYYIDAKRPFELSSANVWDVFISAYNDSERVQTIFEHASASRKIWWILPEYRYSQNEWPNGGAEVVPLTQEAEAELIAAGLSGIQFSPDLKVCIDITGFMRQHILFLMRFLLEKGVPSFDLLYSEPKHYSRKADTKFALDEAYDVRQIAGYEGLHGTDMTNDVLLMGAGYDHSLISRVILSKDHARVVQLHGLPSLSADMYHEAVLRLDRVGGSFEVAEDLVFFSSANDPFVTAAVLSNAFSVLNRAKPITNLYLSTLATKPQAVGFGLFYLRERMNTASSIIFPCIRQYDRETGTGVGRSWIYPINL